MFMIKLYKKVERVNHHMSYLIKKCEFNGYKVLETESGVYVGALLPCKKEAGLHIYDLNGLLLETIEFSKDLFLGDAVSCFIYNLSLKDKAYRLFTDSNDFVDPNSRRVIGNNEFGKTVDEKSLYSTLHSAKSPKGFENDKALMIPYSDAVFYMCHLRGLTMNDPLIKDDRGTFKAASLKAKALKKLGVTSVIFMPVYERIEHKKAVYANNLSYKDKNNELPLNYWGFGPGYYYAPKASYSACEDAAYEFKCMVYKFHELGLEIILTFDFCGLKYEEISNILRYWIYEYHVDGFRIFGSCDYQGFINDPFLKNTKLIFEKPFEELNNLKNVSYKNIAVIDRDFRNLARRFLKGDEDCVSKISEAIKENHSGYAVIRNITDFDGLTLNDLVSYERKHNEANNEDNTDGTDYNYSWNCGQEGITTKKAILKLRLRQIKNALLLVFLCQGAPMITAGDEFLSSNSGNNNPYCQDNEIGWVTYNTDKVSKTIYKYIKNLIEFRKNNIILHQPFELKGYDYLSCKMPDISFHSEEAWKINKQPISREFSMLLGGDYERQFTGKNGESILVIYNLHWEEKCFWMPKVKKGYEWVLVNASDYSDCSFDYTKNEPVEDEYVTLKGRTIAIFTSSKKPG